MKTTEIICDQCRNELTKSVYTPKSAYIQLALSSEEIVPKPAIMEHPPIERSHHFCDLHCLREWINDL